VGGLPCGWLITDVNGQPMKEPPYPPLAQGKVRHVGERVAVVIAESLARRGMPPSSSRWIMKFCRQSSTLQKAKGAPAIHEAAPDNACYVWALGDKAAVDSALPRRRTSPGSISSTTA